MKIKFLPIHAKPQDSNRVAGLEAVEGRQILMKYLGNVPSSYVAAMKNNALEWEIIEKGEVNIWCTESTD
jgi:hypothetical protein